MTPEAKVKEQVKAVLKKFAPYLYQFWPVPMGMGASTLDCIGGYCGISFAIETKAPGEKPTLRQELVIEDMRAANIRVFVIDGADGFDTLEELEHWLRALELAFDVKRNVAR